MNKIDQLIEKSIPYVLVIAIIMFSIMAIAIGNASADQKVILAWDDQNTSIDGYHLYQRDQAGSYDYANPVWVGTEKMVSLTLPDGKYAFVVRAYTGDQESANSNEVIFEASSPLPPVIIPGRPKNLTITFE